jgi:hypothetical protein
VCGSAMGAVANAAPQVYKAENRSTGEVVAIKVVRLALAVVHA